MSSVEGEGMATAPDGSKVDEALRPMPRSHDDIRPGWLTAALRSRGLDVAVRSFHRRPMGEGVGMMATIELVDLEYDKGSGPETVVVKLPATNEANRAVAVAFDIYRREVLFYRDIADRTPACTPRIFYADVDGASDFVLIMEDLSSYRLGDQLEGCSVPDAELAMVELGKLHASFWDNVDRPELDFIPYETPSNHGKVLREGARPAWDVTEEVFGDAVPESMRAQKERFLAAIPRMQQWLTSPPITVAHGDFRMDNLFFGLKADHEPVVALDWQGCLRSKGARDVAYLLSQSMHTEERRAKERDLVQLWRATLVAGGVTGYSPQQAWEDYRRSVLFLWTLVVVIAGSLDASNERGRAWMTQMIKRSAAAIDDLDLLPLLAEFE